MSMSSPIAIATVAIQGASVAVAGELSVRSLSPKRNKVLLVRVCKFILGFTMAVKTILFLAFHASIGNTSCNIIGRISDFFYHLSMTAGTAVLVSRVHSIIPIQWKRFALITHISMVIFRLSVGIVDTGVVVIGVFENGSCDYTDADYWGPVYTLYDTLIDLYVTFMISAVLITHIRSLDLGSVRVNITLYTSVVYHNIIRSVLLTIVNLISATFIITKNNNEYLMLVWPIINIIFVTLVGYDSDVTKAIRKLQQKHWHREATSSAQISLGQASLGEKMMTRDDLECQIPDTVNEGSNVPTERVSSEQGLKEPVLFNKAVGNASYDTDHTQIE